MENKTNINFRPKDPRYIKGFNKNITEFGLESFEKLHPSPYNNQQTNINGKIQVNNFRKNQEIIKKNNSF